MKEFIGFEDIVRAYARRMQLSENRVRPFVREIFAVTRNMAESLKPGQVLDVPRLGRFDLREDGRCYETERQNGRIVKRSASKKAAIRVHFKINDELKRKFKK